MNIKGFFKKNSLEKQVGDIARNYVEPTAKEVLPAEVTCIQDTSEVVIKPIENIKVVDDSRTIKQIEKVEVKEDKPKNKRKNRAKKTKTKEI